MPARGSEPPVRCAWPKPSNLLYVRYHDTEWGVPERDGRALFEKLLLDGAQAGLSWETILNKRENYRRAFDGFDPEKIARYGSRRTAALLSDPGIVRNRQKVAAFIGNAKAYLALVEREGEFGPWLWRFVDGTPVQNRFTTTRQIPARTAVSDAMSKELKARGFKFVGSTIVYAFMQAVGMVNDHLVSCFRHEPCARLGRARLRRG
ncbi:MAG: DNA-3-methyladenine glycosylase I [Candidatus Eisenbacteria bacterium]|nr:DNA-3-methyladenine glycosylase I [Candidatus Eisenbacteria bacterium]